MSKAMLVSIVMEMVVNNIYYFPMTTLTEGSNFGVSGNVSTAHRYDPLKDPDMVRDLVDLSSQIRQT